MGAFHYNDERVYAYRAQDLFDLVGDVARYPEFLPWCLNASIIQRAADGFYARLTVGNAYVSQAFTSHDRLIKPGDGMAPWVVEVTSSNGPFAWLKSRWVLTPIDATSTLVTFTIGFELTSSLLRAAFAPVFEKAVKRLSLSFEERAQVLYAQTPKL